MIVQSSLQRQYPKHRRRERKLIHCGDLIGADTLRASIKLGVRLHVVHGNNIGSRRIFATHFPYYGRGMACTGDYDLVCCGHSHVADRSAV
jgi:uncharacterized protein